MKRLVSTLASIWLFTGLFLSTVSYAQYDTGEGFDIAWTLDPREHPDIFDRGPAFGGSRVVTGMDFDDDGNEEILFATDETLAPGGPDPGFLDVFLYEATGDDTYEYVWHWTEPEPSNSLPGLHYADLDEDGLWEIYFGIPTIDDATDLFIFEQAEDGTFPDAPTATYDYGREAAEDFRPAGFASGDFDGDGTLELATVSRTSNARGLVVIEPTAGIDAFATFDIELDIGNEILGGGAVYDVDSADFDNDGQTEIWVNTWNNFSWTVFEATGEDTYEMQVDIDAAKEDNDPGSHNAHKLLFYDADEDGRIELMAPMTNGKLYVLQDVDDVSTITGDSFVEVGMFDLTGGSRGADLGDVDGDDLFDIIASGGTGEKVYRIEYTGSGEITDSLSYTWTTILESVGGATEYYYPLRIADDLDGDGKDEVVIMNRYASDEGQPLLVVLESITGESVDIENPTEVPDQFVLRQNYPNPFNPTTTIEYELKSSAAVSIRVYDSLGRLVSTLVSNEMQTPGVYSVEWNGMSDAGAHVASGVYFYTLESRDFRKARQMVLMK